jgi:Ca2+-binding RTX toxin-like protein
MAVPVGTTFEKIFPGTSGKDNYPSPDVGIVFDFDLKDWDDYKISGLGDNDLLVGGHGDDSIVGGAGDDIISGGYGKNDLIGGDGFDTLDYSWYGKNAGPKADSEGINAGFRTDVVNGRSGPDLGTQDKISGFERLIGSDYADKVFGDDSGLSIYGGRGADQLSSGSGADRFSGGSGNDTINGGLGRDKISGGTGKDSLVGGAGADTIHGGAGGDIINTGVVSGELDRVVYTSIKDSTVAFSTRDILVFKNGLVKIDLEGIDVNRTRAGDQDFDFIGRNEFTGGRAELRYEASTRLVDGLVTTIIVGDVNLDKKADFAITVIGNRAFTDADFDL